MNRLFWSLIKSDLRSIVRDGKLVFLLLMLSISVGLAGVLVLYFSAKVTEKFSNVDELKVKETVIVKTSKVELSGTFFKLLFRELDREGIPSISDIEVEEESSLSNRYTVYDGGIERGANSSLLRSVDPYRTELIPDPRNRKFIFNRRDGSPYKLSEKEAFKRALKRAERAFEIEEEQGTQVEGGYIRGNVEDYKVEKKQKKPFKILWLLAGFLTLGMGGVLSILVDLLVGDKERGNYHALRTTPLSIELYTFSRFVLTWCLILFLILLKVLSFAFFKFIFKSLFGDIELWFAWEHLPMMIFWAIILCAFFTLLTSYLCYVSASVKQAQLLLLPTMTLLCVFMYFCSSLEPQYLGILLYIPVAFPWIYITDAYSGGSHFVGWSELMMAVVVHLGACWFLFRRCIAVQKSENWLDNEKNWLREEKIRYYFSWWMLATVSLMIVVPGNVPLFSDLKGQVGLIQYVLLGFGGFCFAKIYSWKLRDIFPLGEKKYFWGMPLFFALGVTMQPLASWIGRFWQILFPVSEKLEEYFIGFIFPEGASVWILLLLISVSPGLMEEFFFRGLFFKAWNRYGKPLQLCFWSALVFSLYHLSLPKILPTFCIGFLLAHLRLRTGSILPAVALHMGNNATAVVLLSLDKAELLENPLWLTLSLVSLAGYGFWAMRGQQEGT